MQTLAGFPFCVVWGSLCFGHCDCLSTDHRGFFYVPNDAETHSSKSGSESSLPDNEISLAIYMINPPAGKNNGDNVVGI